MNLLSQEYNDNPVHQTRGLETLLFSSPKCQIQKGRDFSVYSCPQHLENYLAHSWY